MAPRSLLMLACFNDDAVNVSVPAKKNKHESEKRQRQRRRWTGEILTAIRRPRIWAVREEGPCEVYVEKHRAQASKPKLPEQQTTPRREGSRAPVLQSNKSPSNDGAPEAVAVDGRRKRKGLRVRFVDLPPQEIISAAPPVEPRFPTGVLGDPPPESFARSGADMTAAFLMSVIADSASATQVDGDLVDRWTERKAACSRRLSYLTDYCPFQREDEEEAEHEESEPETTTTRRRPEVRPVKTGLPFDTPESEAEFVKAIRSRYLRKDDFLLRHAYERRHQSLLVAAGEGK